MVTPTVRFGRTLFDYPDYLDFGAWGTIETSVALDAFQETHDYFDQQEVKAEELKRRQLITAARRYYDGHHVKPLKVEEGAIDDNVLINFCRSIVDDSVSWLFGNPETGVLSMEVTAGDEPASDEADTDDLEPTDSEAEVERVEAIQRRRAEMGAMLEEIYDHSGGFFFFKRLGMRGSLSGHVFIKIVLPDGNDPQPRLVVLDPMLMTVRIDPTDDTRVLAYKMEWKGKERTAGMRQQPMIYRQLAVMVAPNTWIVGDFKSKDRAKREWQVVIAGGWPYPWAPIVDCPNLEPGWGYYGLSDLEDIAGLNDAINFLSSNIMRIIKHHGHPKTVGTGFRADEVQDTAIDSFWTVENAEARVTNLEMQSDLGSSLNFLSFIRTAFWTIGRGLDPSVYKDAIGQITNFALRVLAIRSIHKMGDKRLAYGKALRQINSRLADILTIPVADTLISWPMPLPEDPEAELRALESEMSMGITSLQTASEERGRSWEVEQARIRQEKKTRMTLGQFLLGEFDGGKGVFGSNRPDGEETDETDDENSEE